MAFLKVKFSQVLIILLMCGVSFGLIAPPYSFAAEQNTLQDYEDLVLMKL